MAVAIKLSNVLEKGNSPLKVNNWPKRIRKDNSECFGTVGEFNASRVHPKSPEVDFLRGVRMLEQI